MVVGVLVGREGGARLITAQEGQAALQPAMDAALRFLVLLLHHHRRGRTPGETRV